MFPDYDRHIGRALYGHTQRVSMLLLIAAGILIEMEYMQVITAFLLAFLSIMLAGNELSRRGFQDTPDPLKQHRIRQL